MARPKARNDSLITRSTSRVKPSSIRPRRELPAPPVWGRICNLRFRFWSRDNFFFAIVSFCVAVCVLRRATRVLRRREEYQHHQILTDGLKTMLDPGGHVHDRAGRYRL